MTLQIFKIHLQVELFCFANFAARWLCVSIGGKFSRNLTTGRTTAFQWNRPKRGGRALIYANFMQTTLAFCCEKSLIRLLVSHFVASEKKNWIFTAHRHRIPALQSITCGCCGWSYARKCLQARITWRWPKIFPRSSGPSHQLIECEDNDDIFFNETCRVSPVIWI